MSLKTLKIFIACSSELKEDREQFRQFISLENERLVKQNIFLEIVQWEHFLDAMSDSRLQNEYNKAIRESDIVLCLFFTKAGKYTAEEFDTAYQVFKETGKPLIWTYFKNAPINYDLITEEISTLLAFKKKVSDLGHFPTHYGNISELKYQFRNQLDKVLAKLGAPNPSPSNTTEGATATKTTEPVRNTFNEQLARRLIEAIQVYSLRAKKFLENVNRIATDWETANPFLRSRKRNYCL